MTLFCSTFIIVSARCSERDEYGIKIAATILEFNRKKSAEYKWPFIARQRDKSMYLPKENKHQNIIIPTYIYRAN